jgi:hypothetical protein
MSMEDNEMRLLTRIQNNQDCSCMLKNATHLLATHLLGFSKIQNGPYYQQMD